MSEHQNLEPIPPNPEMASELKEMADLQRNTLAEFARRLSIPERITAGEDLEPGDTVYFNSMDGKCYKAKP